MFGYITLGSNDLTTSAAFFDAFLAQLGGTQLYKLDHLIGYSLGEGDPLLVLTKPQDGEEATIGNGTMVALTCESQAQVQTLHALALSLGATNEGDPGLRGKSFYGAYFRSPEGHKFNLHHQGS